MTAPKLRKRFVVIGVIVLAAGWIWGLAWLRRGPPDEVWVAEEWVTDSGPCNEIAALDAPGGATIAHAYGRSRSGVIDVDVDPGFVAQALGRCGFTIETFKDETYSLTRDRVVCDGRAWRRLAQCEVAGQRWKQIR